MKQELLVVLFIITCVILSGCIGKEPVPEPNISKNKTEIEDTKKIIHDTGMKYEAIYSELPKTSNIQFKIGDKFVYETPKKESGWLITTYTVEKTEKINGRECFVVFQEDNSTSIETLFGRKEIINTITHFKYYYDKENGKALKVKVNNITVKDGAENLRATDMSFFAYWMLGLKDDAKWEIKFTETIKTYSSDLVERRKFEFGVVGKEKVNNRECFKVEKRIINLDNNKVEEINYFWVDIKNRILIKREFHEGNLKYFEQNLVSELSS